MINRPKCVRCNAPIPAPIQDSSYHPKCRMIMEVGSDECVKCGGEDVKYALHDGNLIQYHEECGNAALNPHIEVTNDR